MNKVNTLRNWLETTCLLGDFELQPLANDASFREYFRVQRQNSSYIVMLAPPNKEDINAFISIAESFGDQGLCVPKVINRHAQGFVLLSDLGNDLYLKILTQDNAEDLYTRALSIVPQIQLCKPRLVNNQALGLFDERLIRFELSLFTDWFLTKHLKQTLTPKLRILLEKIYQPLISAMLKQPRVCVHRDYHSRNLLLVNKEKVGILDFQDAVYGPITYDAVSLLKDAYIDWPEILVEKWTLNFHDMLGKKHSPSREEFSYWFDLTGIQRHLKVLGIFSRLYYRDHKPQYLANTNRLLCYLQRVCEKYSELTTLKYLLQENTSNKLSEK